MRVHFIGNVCNNHYVLAKGLRSIGVDAHLFLIPSDLIHSQTLPESEDGKLLHAGYPEWIHVIKRTSHVHHPWAIPGKWIDFISQCDVIHTHGTMAPYIMHCRTPYIIHPFGGDFFKHPFHSANSKWKQLHPYFWGRRAKIQEAYRYADAIILSAWNHLWKEGYEKLLTGKKIAPIPLGIDTQKFSYGYRSRNRFGELFSKFDFFIFQTARHCWSKDVVAKEGGDKGNDILIKGFSRFAKLRNKALLVFVDGRGGDSARSRKLVESLNISGNVQWIDPVPRENLILYLHSCDIFVDSLHTIYGSAALEAMSCGAPVMMNGKVGRYKEIMGDIPPIVHVDSTEDDVAEKLFYHASHRDKLRRISKEQRQFVEENHSQSVICHRLVNLYENILGEKSDFKYLSQNFFL